MAKNDKHSSNGVQNAAASEIAELNGIMQSTLRNEFVNAAANVFFMFKGFVDAGFTEKQALQLVAAILTGGKNENEHH